MLDSWQVTDGVFIQVTFQGDFFKGAKHKDEQGVRKPQRVHGTVYWVSNSVAASIPEAERESSPEPANLETTCRTYHFLCVGKTQVTLYWKSSEDKHATQPVCLLPIACPLNQSQLESQLQGEGTIAVVGTVNLQGQMAGRDSRSRGQSEDSQLRIPREMKDSRCVWPQVQYFLKIIFLFYVYKYFMYAYLSEQCVYLVPMKARRRHLMPWNQTVVHHLIAENWLQIPVRVTSALTVESSLQLP